MIVYIESNFFQEIALQQKEGFFASTILEFAEQKKITLAFPDFAFCEPFSTVMYRNRDRRKILNNLNVMLKQLARSKYHEQIMARAEPVISTLRGVEGQELDSLDKVVSRLLNAGIPLHVHNECFKQAILYREKYNFSAQDSIVYASIITDLQLRSSDEKKCFLSLDHEAFGDVPAIKTELATYNCRYIKSFRQGIDYIQSAI